MTKYYLIALLIVLFICCIIKKECYNKLTTNKNRYIFWTGGFDSTFCILKAIFIDNDTVIPIYLSGIIDNIPSKSVRRKNNKEEINSIQNIINVLKKIIQKKVNY